MATQAPPRYGRPLSARERQILQLVAEGQHNNAIGTALNLSPLTVKSHLHRIGRKLGTGNRAGMVGAGFRQGILR